MGLDTSHDCWHGPYSSFMEWRRMLHGYVAPDQTHTLEEAWRHGDYETDDHYPISVLMTHSDCEGEISSKDCGPLADRLQQVVDAMPKKALCDQSKPATERFIAGLRKAAAAKENVEFH